MEHLPTDPFELYQHLCLKKHNPKKKKKYKNSVYADIKKSWIMLSDSEKQHFIDKFDEYKTKCKKTFAAYLQNAEPYMKRKENTGILEISNKDTTRSQEVLSESVHNEIIAKKTNVDAAYESFDNVNINSSQQPEYFQLDRQIELQLEKDKHLQTETEIQPLTEMQSETEIQPLIEIQSEKEIQPLTEMQSETEIQPLTEMQSETEIQPETEIHQETDSIETQSRTTEVQLVQTDYTLTEPPPPNVTNAKELFEALAPPGTNVNTAWSSLSRLQKSRYGHATRVLKKEYIKKYKAYLECLTSEQLFNYYINKII